MKTYPENVTVWLADLTYTQQTVSADVMPQAIGGIATFTEQVIALSEPIRLFKYPEKLIERLEDTKYPTVIGFSNYIWNHDLSYEFATFIKRQSPETIVIFGGPNYPIDREEQIEFLRSRPHVDFYIQKEGEVAFSCLLTELIEQGFDVEAVKAKMLPSVHSILCDGTPRLSDVIERVRDLSEIPSPYSSGRMDEFCDGILMPIIQTNRGCPFACTFCVEGVKYYNKIYRSAADKVAEEIDYIGRKMAELRSQGGRNDLFIADSNFGMYKDDLETCRQLARSRDQYQWPEYINVATGKNQKERILEASRLIDGALRLSGSVQSLDKDVLKNIKRDNISEDGLMDLALEAGKIGANSYSEIILGLPGDSLESHFKTVRTVMEAGFTNMYLFQLMLLPGTELAMPETKSTYEMDCRYRVLPRCYGHYRVGDADLIAAEIEEVCVGTDTLSFEDYLECRALHLIVTIFYNDSLFSSVVKFLKSQGLSIWRWMEVLRDSVPPPGLCTVFESFREATKTELWTSRDALVEFVRQPGIVERFLSGELGNNLLFVHKTRSITDHVDGLAHLAEHSAIQLLEEAGKDTPEHRQFVTEAVGFHRLQMSNLFHGRNDDLHANFTYDVLSFSQDAAPHSDIRKYRHEEGSGSTDLSSMTASEPLSNDISESMETRPSVSGAFFPKSIRRSCSGIRLAVKTGLRVSRTSTMKSQAYKTRQWSSFYSRNYSYTCLHKILGIWLVGVLILLRKICEDY